jgi:tetratricopeptide (TPR) repeat protein
LVVWLDADMRYRTSMFVFAGILISVGLIHTSTASAQYENCTGNPGIDWDIQIGSCTAAIQSGRLQGKNLAFAFVNRGNAYSGKGQNDRAIQDYDQAIKLNPNDADTFFDRGSVYSDKGQYDRAIQDFDQAIKLNPNLALAFNNRGFAYNNKGQYDRAIQDFDQAIKLNPKLALAFNNRGIAYNNKGRYDRAIQDYGQAIKLDPSLTIAINNRAAAIANKTQSTAVVVPAATPPATPKSTEQTALTSSTSPPGRCNALAIAGQIEEAIKVCDEVLRLKPNDADALNSRGLAFLMSGAFDKAINDYDAALKLSPKLASSLYGRGLAVKKKKEEELRAFYRLLGRDETPPDGNSDIAAAMAIRPDIAEVFAGYGIK